MKGVTVIIVAGVVLLGLVGLVTIGSILPYTQNKTTNNSHLPSSPTSTTASASSSSPPSQTSSASGISLENIVAGGFPSATDKQGSGGVTITVHNLYVLYVRVESDGDWHVAVTDGQKSVFITEITPAYQSALGRPPVGSTIDETGVPYCDIYHQSESWHGDTCWEIHPVTSWQTSSGTITHTVIQTAVGLHVSITYANDPISRGSNQTIFVMVSDSDGPVSNTPVAIHVLYQSGLTQKDFPCITSSDGSCSATWRIGGNSTPGTFGVTVMVEGIAFRSSFEVTTA